MMNGNTEKVWTGQSNTNQNIVTGQMYNWSGQTTGANGEHFTGHGDSYTGHNNYHNHQTFNGQEFQGSYPCNGQSYNPPNYSNVQQKTTGHGWNGSNYMTGQHPPPYGGHKKVFYQNDGLTLSYHLEG